MFDLDNDMKNTCFICGIDRGEFEKYNVSFEDHIKYEHNHWNYVYYIIYLRAKNSLDYNGTESYVFEKYEKDDISWFPLDKAMSLSSTRRSAD